MGKHHENKSEDPEQRAKLLSEQSVTVLSRSSDPSKEMPKTTETGMPWWIVYTWWVWPSGVQLKRDEYPLLLLLLQKDPAPNSHKELQNCYDGSYLYGSPIVPRTSGPPLGPGFSLFLKHLLVVLLVDDSLCALVAGI